MTRALALVPAVLLAAGCGSLDEFDVVRSGSATIPGGSAPLPADAIATFPVSLGRDALEAEGIDPNDVDSARLVGLRLEVTEGESLETWLDGIEFQVGAPGLDPVVVARKSGIRALPAGTTAVELDTTGVDLRPYVLAPSTTVTATGSGNAPATATTIRATATVRVDVSVAGVLF